ncbi:adenine deaminase [Methanonatronarchaeum sp. AMET-Sl]|uniref:adenine deaminase n=1 Tax=Methanonatronarchaeum sp. AMET-Sl TaxID=3037654 RepID=UPI00244E3D01|nr:adenine deaminase [Methanonatronarchaeum sp. AMET-Sl]WGI16666.1 adenine deaminase [Methanonatronarchaeum sp. AMET-Sl]
MNLKEKIDVAKGETNPELVITGKALSVFSGEVFKTDIAINNGLITGLGDYESENQIKTDGVIIPGLIDAHMHIESTFLKPIEFTKAVLPYGTTTVIADPHEIANVAGVKGIKYLIKSSKKLPLDFYFMAPSCVPANESLETYGATISASEIKEMLKWKEVLGLGELMNFTGVLNKDPELIEKLEVSKNHKIDGHCPGLTGNKLNGYLISGANTDHECVTIEEVREKIRKGMKVVLREGSASRDLKRLVGTVNKNNYTNFMLGTDDLDPTDIEKRGHMNHRVKLCIDKNIPPEIAIQMATHNTAKHYGLNSGAIAPGYKADITIVNNLKELKVESVFKDGELVWENEFKKPLNENPTAKTKNYVKIPEITQKDLEIDKKHKIRVIDVFPDKIITKESAIKINKDRVPDPEKDIAKVTVIDRHGKGKHIGLGVVRGFGLKKGALASTVGHDSHNCISIGTNDKDMITAINKLKEIGGGLVVATNGETETLPLPIAGLMSDLPYTKVNEKLNKVRKKAQSLGTKIEHPFMKMSFLSLPVIPEIRITTHGLVDVNENRIVDLWID